MPPKLKTDTAKIIAVQVKDLNGENPSFLLQALNFEERGQKQNES